jgi:hypothetical protein
MQLRDYQEKLSYKAIRILNDKKIVYLSMEVRTGKTLTALNTAQLYGAKNVLFLTKKRAIKSIEYDYTNVGFDFKLTVITNQSAHKYIDTYDLIISDEHHRNGAFPKPNKMTKFIKENYSCLPMIFLSGTPHPESYSQIYHQFWCSSYNPFNETNFYKWAKVYVDVRDRRLGYATVKDYSRANYEDIKPIIEPYFVKYTQEAAGFTTDVKEHVLNVKMSDKVYMIADNLKRDKIVKGSKGLIIADTSIKEMQKLHQIYSGTVILEDGKSIIIDTTKGEYIKERFNGKKIGIFYKFKAEYDVLKGVFGDALTNDLDEFNTTDKNIALQIVSGSEGISLRNANFLVYYNIDFSSKNYWQSRDRMTTMDRKFNDVYWIFTQGGLEDKIYKQVLKKKNYTTSVYKNDVSAKGNKRVRGLRLFSSEND